jgi:arylsulfatase A
MANTELSLYDLDNDPGEQANVIEAHPKIVSALTSAAEPYREMLGDSLQKRKGSEVRGPGRLADQN